MCKIRTAILQSVLPCVLCTVLGIMTNFKGNSKNMEKNPGQHAMWGSAVGAVYELTSGKDDRKNKLAQIPKGLPLETGYEQ